MSSDSSKEKDLANEVERLKARVKELEGRIKDNELERSYRSLFHDVNYPIVYLNLNADILIINSMAAKMLSGQPDSFVGQSFLDILPEMVNQIRERIQFARETGQGKNYTDLVKLPSGESRWFSSLFHPVRSNQGEIYAIQLVSFDITHHMEIEEKLRLLSMVVEQSTEGMALVDLDGNIRFINNAFAEMHGYTQEELIGKSLDIFHSREQLPAVRRANEQIKKTGHFFGEIWHTRKDGSVFPSIMNNSVLRDKDGKYLGMIGTMRDITAQKEAETALRESEEKYRQLVDGAPDPIVVMDLEDNIILANKKCADDFGTVPENITGKNVRDLLPDTAELISQRNREAVRTGRHYEFEDYVRMPDGDGWFRTRIRPVSDSEGKIYGVIVISRNISDLKISEKLIRKTSDDLRAEHKALLEKNIALQQVLQHIEGHRRDSLQKIQLELEKAILPPLQSLKKKLGGGDLKELEAFEKVTNIALGRNQNDFSKSMARLTSRESEICDLIKNGLTTKQISDNLKLSPLTVSKHREQIRKKLNLTNKNLSLATFLRSH